MHRRFTAGFTIALALGALTACGEGDQEDAASSSSSAATSDAAPDETFSEGPAPTDGSDSSAPADGSDEAPSESSEADASASPAPDEADFPGDTSPDSAEAGADAALVLVDVRSGAHDGYDRVVLEFTGPGTPGWTAQYADSASRQGSGEEISVDGEALIDIAITGTSIPMPTDPTVNAGPVAPSGTSAVTGIFNDGTFEGITHVVVGTSGEHPFRVFAVADPPRVVIDVQN